MTFPASKRHRPSLLVRCLVAPALLCLLVAGARAENFVVQDIRLEGLQRVSAGVVFTALPIGIHDTVDDADLPRFARALFQTGNFDDVELGRDGDVLVVRVGERPSISDIKIDGNKALETASLMKALKSAGITEGQVFKRSTLESMQMELQRQYVSQGRYDARIEANVEVKPRNRVAIHIDIHEGSVARIKQVNVVGNSVFPTSLLLDQLELKAGGWLSWATGDDKYSREKLSGDLEKLKSYYMDRGYINFEVESTQVAISPDREGVYITIHVNEGALYTVSGFDFSGDIILPPDDLKHYVMLREGFVFSQQMMTATQDALTRRLGNEGYTFAKVTGIPDVDESRKTVAVKFFIDPGKRTYVRRIDFRGNTKTVDEVLRREMRQMEGGIASTEKLDQSRVRLERLGFFKEVKTENQRIPGVDDMMDVLYTVEEQPSGSIGASLGYSQDSGMILGANLQQNNFLGTGKQVGIGLSRSNYQSMYRFSYVNPYYTEDGVSRGFSVYYRASDLSKTNVASYTTDTVGGAVSFGYPIKETERLGFSFGYSSTLVKTGVQPAQEIRSTPEPYYWIRNYVAYGDNDANPATPNTLVAPEMPVTNNLYATFTDPGFIDRYGSRYNELPFTISWVQSELNKGRLATRGHSQELAFEIALPGSDATYYRATYNGQYFLPLGRSLTLRFHTDLGYGNGYGSTPELPFWNNFYSGGYSSVRGFRSNTLGPRSSPAYSYRYTRVVYDSAGKPTLLPWYAYIQDPVTGKLATQQMDYGDPFGGNMQVEGGVELLFPTPFAKDQRSIRTAAFLDSGNVFSSYCRSTQVNCSGLNLGELRYSVGVGLTWITGFGPMTFSLARPLNKGKYDKTEFFQFSLGQSF